MTSRRNLSRLAACAVLLVLTAPFLLGQADPDPTPLLRAAVEKIHPSGSDKTRFTYLLLDHTQNFNLQGKKTGEMTRLFEVLYIADLQYRRLLEVNGKPLKGKALLAEQRRYDDAVRERTALDEAARARQLHYQTRNVSFSFRQLLTQYRNTVVEHTQVDGRACLLIDSMPLESAADAPKRHLRIWIDPQQSEFLRVEWQLLGDEEEILLGSKGAFDFTYIDGVMLDTRKTLDVIVPARDDQESPSRVVTEQTFSNYRKFVSTVRILPETDDNKP